MDERSRRCGRWLEAACRVRFGFGACSFLSDAVRPCRSPSCEWSFGPTQRRAAPRRRNAQTPRPDRPLSSLRPPTRSRTRPRLGGGLRRYRDQPSLHTKDCAGPRGQASTRWRPPPARGRSTAAHESLRAFRAAALPKVTAAQRLRGARWHRRALTISARQEAISKPRGSPASAGDRPTRRNTEGFVVARRAHRCVGEEWERQRRSRPSLSLLEPSPSAPRIARECDAP
jgi:hypothetical protein